MLIGKEDAGIQPASIQADEYDFLVDYAGKYNINTVLEFGPGASTMAFVEAGCRIVSLENDERFYNYMFEKYSGYDVELFLYKDEPVIVLPALDRQIFDMAFIDAPAANRRKHFARLNSCMFVAQHTKRILLHDSKRIGELLTQMVFVELGWRVIEVCSSERGIAEMTL